ncbi:MAG: PDZ domain-containing protein [Azospirillum sp.]|nr:PDZ domain-containing protein [Azospirillum sp.]
MVTRAHWIRLRGILTASVVGVLMVCGCAGDPVTQAAAPPLPIGEEVLAVAFNRISEIYLDAVDLGRLTVDGLAGLKIIEPKLSAERNGRAVRVQIGSRVAAELLAPEPGDASAWASLTARAIDRSRMFSAALRDASANQIHQAVLDAMIGDLDAYSRYAGPQRAGTERAQREGYGGIGISVEPEGVRYVVREVLAHSPAARSGLAVGDLVQAIDGEPVSSLSIRDVRDRLRGPVGSVVMVTLGNDALSGRRVTIRRERVIPNTVTVAIEKGVAVFKIDRFNAATTGNLKEAVIAAQAELGAGALGYVLDLRGNPGGLLDQAVSVADMFVRRGRLISTAGRHPDSWQRFDATGDDILDGQPMVVLVDGRSASASEVVAAALQDSGRAVVVGASSFGKGSVQTVTRLPNDGELFLTWARIYAPSGYTLHRQGVQPTICTSNAEGSPAQALEPLRHGRINLPDTLAAWRAAAPDDEAALAHLREACPWKAHEPALDLQVAEKLLADRPLFMSALAMTVVAER